MSLFVHAARVFMAMRDCIVPDRSAEAQEEIVADLHNCLEQLHERLSDMETRIATVTHAILVHGKASQNQSLPIQERIRERSKAKHNLVEKKRIQVEYDKIQKNAYLIQNQIDAIVSSQLNMVVVDAMKQFTHNASRLALPGRTMELENLEEHLTDRTREISEFQEAIANISNACTSSMGGQADLKTDAELEEELMQELNTFFSSDSSESLPLKTNEPTPSSEEQRPPVLQPTPTNTISQNIPAALEPAQQTEEEPPLPLPAKNMEVEAPA